MMKWKNIRKVVFLTVLIVAGFYLTCDRVFAAEWKQQESSLETGITDAAEDTVRTDIRDLGEETPKDEEGGEGSADSGNMTVFSIDNRNLYSGMDKTYTKGYVPKVKKGKAVIVLPLLANVKIKGGRIKSTLNLGDAETIPFVQKNYEKDISLKKHKIGREGKKKECFLIAYTLDLKKKRYNGAYPVIITVSAQDEQGNEVRQDFTVYVTITDGSDMDTAEGTQTDETENPQFAPKVIVESYTFSKETIASGDSFTVKITLKNTSKTDTVKNMLVTAAPTEQIEMKSKSDSVYVEELQTQKTCEVTYELAIHSTALQGQYSVPITLDYADSKGTTYMGQGSVKIMVELPVKIEIDPVAAPEEIQMGETIELQIQVMNLGKGRIYNVRAVVEADGLRADQTAFIGDIEAGSALSGSIEVTAEGLSGDTLYGKTQGTVIFYYEDETGKEMSEEKVFETVIISPLDEKKWEEKPDDTGQWWVIMAVIVMILSGMTGALCARKFWHAQSLKKDMEEMKNYENS